MIDDLLKVEGGDGWRNRYRGDGALQSAVDCVVGLKC